MSECPHLFELLGPAGQTGQVKFRNRQNLPLRQARFGPEQALAAVLLERSLVVKQLSWARSPAAWSLMHPVARSQILLSPPDERLRTLGVSPASQGVRSMVTPLHVVGMIIAAGLESANKKRLLESSLS